MMIGCKHACLFLVSVLLIRDPTLCVPSALGSSEAVTSATCMLDVPFEKLMI